MQGLAQDIRFVWRTAQRNPAFAVTTTFLVAAGIALSVTAFSLVRAYLIRPLPYPDADRVMQILADETRRFVNLPRDFQRIDLSGMSQVFPWSAGNDPTSSTGRGSTRDSSASSAPGRPGGG
jgi:hypothetical protein